MLSYWVKPYKFSTILIRLQQGDPHGSFIQSRLNVEKQNASLSSHVFSIYPALVGYLEAPAQLPREGILIKRASVPIGIWQIGVECIIEVLEQAASVPWGKFACAV